MIDYAMLENMGALEKGVLLPTCDIEAELAKMSPEEARKAKRKWRKLMRKAAKRYRQTVPMENESTQVSKATQRYYVRRRLREIGQELVSE
jgi:hypothetical protein